MSKTISILALILVVCAPLQAQVPVEVSAAFQSQFPAINKVEWEKEGNLYEAEWEENNREICAIYNKEGHLQAMKREIAPEDLPQSVAQSLELHYPGSHPTEVERIEWATGIEDYEVEFEVAGEELELTFSLEGQILMKGVEEEDEND